VAFGPWAALALSLGGSAAGAAVVFALARRWGRPLVERLVRSETVDHYTALFAAGSGVWLFLAFVIPFLPGDALCALAGLSPVSFRRFLVLSTLGRAPSTALSIVVAELSAGPTWVWPGAALALAAALGFALVNRSRAEAWLVRRAAAGTGPRGRRRPGAEDGPCAGIGGAFPPRTPPVSGPRGAAEWSVAEEVRPAPSLAQRRKSDTLDWPESGAFGRPGLAGRASRRLVGDDAPGFV
jgi:membrane protein DedA with SNARE-associated domain